MSSCSNEQPASSERPKTEDDPVVSEEKERLVEPDGPITMSEKREFREMVTRLPFDAEYLQPEAIEIARPYLPVFLDITDENYEEMLGHPLDAFLIITLTRMYLSDRESTTYIAEHFSEIANDRVKMRCALRLYTGSTSLDLETMDPGSEIQGEVKEFLAGAINDPDASPLLQQAVGNAVDLEWLKQQLLGLPVPATADSPPLFDAVLTADVAEPTMDLALTLADQPYQLPEFQRFSGAFRYAGNTCGFSGDGTFYGIRPFPESEPNDDACGVLCRVDITAGKVEDVDIPWPQMLKAGTGYLQGIDYKSQLLVGKEGRLLIRFSEVVSASGRSPGDLLAPRGDLVPMTILVARSADGEWRTAMIRQTEPRGGGPMYFDANDRPSILTVQRGSAAFIPTLSRINDEPSINSVSEQLMAGHLGWQPFYACDGADAFLCTLRPIGFGRNQEVWQIDYDEANGEWPERRLVAKFDHLSVFSRLFLLGSQQWAYLWNIGDEALSDAEDPFAGVYFGLDKGSVEKVAPKTSGFTAFQNGDRIVVAYTVSSEPKKVFFQVIEQGKHGPATSTELHDRKYSFPLEDLIVGPAGDRHVWCADTRNKNFYRLKYTEAE